MKIGINFYHKIKDLGEEEEAIKEGINQLRQSQEGVFDRSGQTLLHSAILADREDVLNFLLKEGREDINGENKDGDSVLKLAIKSNLTDIVQQLLKRESIVIDKHLLHLAVKNNNLTVVKTLVSKGVNVDEEDDRKQTPLYLAAQNGYFDIVKFLVQSKAKLNTYLSPLIVALSAHQKEVALFLIDKMADQDKSLLQGKYLYVGCDFKYTPASAAAEFGMLSVLKRLDEKINILERQEKSISLLWIASSSGQEEVVKYLIKEKEVDVNERSGNGDLPLAAAAISGSMNVVKVLLQHGADCNILVPRTTTILSEWPAVPTEIRTLLKLWRMREAYKNEPIEWQLERTLYAEVREDMLLANGHAVRKQEDWHQIVSRLNEANKDIEKMKTIINDWQVTIRQSLDQYKSPEEKEALNKCKSPEEKEALKQQQSNERWEKSPEKVKYDFILDMLDKIASPQASMQGQQVKASRLRFFKGNTQPMLPPGAEEIEHILTKNHAINRAGLILKLKKYIARIESYQKDEKRISDINFKQGFWVMKDSRAINREANYNLARDLLDELLDENKSIDNIFNDDNIERLRKQYPYTRSVKNSAELYDVIKDGKKLAEAESKLGNKSSL